MIRLPKKKYQNGQILLAILIAIAVFAILAHSIFTLIASSYDLVTFNKARITARHLAQEKIELIRNLPYLDVATIGGVPNGTLILQSETIARNGLNYSVNTQIIYIDDPFDNSAPTDTSPEDYKRVRVEVSWEGLAASRRNPVLLITDVSAEANAIIDGGSLVIQVNNANLDPVSQANVTIVSSGISPAVNVSTQTDSAGTVVIPGMTPCVECYQITVTKAGFSTDKTYTSAEVTNPSKPRASIYLDDVTHISFAIDALGSLDLASLNSRENGFAALGSIPFRLYSNKIIGTDAYAQPVYKYDENLSTSGAGDLDLSNMEWGVYYLEMPQSTSYDISGTTPLPPLYLEPTGTLPFSFVVSAHTAHNLLLTVKNTSQQLIASASAKLYDDGGFNEVKNTGIEEDPDYGQVLFSNLIEETYHLEATASGYLNYNQDYDVLGTTNIDIVLTPQ